MFDEARAERALKFISNLTHTKDQWAGKAFDPRPWQRDIVRELFGRMRADDERRRAYRTCYIEIPRKNGKALALDTPIATPYGWVSMGDLQPGDAVFDERGRACSVVAVGPVQRDRPCFRVTFGDGSQVIADAEHEWMAGHRDWSAGPRLVTTGEMKPSCRIPVAAALELDAAELPIPPYTLGAWLGDGRCDGASLSSEDEEIYTAIAAEGVPVKRSRWEARLGGDRAQAARSSSVQAKLREMGLLEAKRIPPVYQRSAGAQRLALLRGLMDTDGYCSKAGQCELTTIYPDLATDALELVRGLGMKASCSVGRATMGGRDCGPKYRVQFWAFAGTDVFTVERKLQRQKPRPQAHTRASSHYVQSIDPVDPRDVRCIQVDSPSRLFLAGESMVPTHNSEIAAAFALYGLVGDGVIGAEVYSAAADRDQAALVFNVASQMVRNDERLAARLKIIDSQKRIVDHKTGSFYRAISAEAYSKHGFNASMVIYDELHAAPNRDLWDVLTTSMGTRAEPLVIAITTAGYDRHSICWEQHDYARKILDGTVSDPTFFPVIYAAPEGAEWTDEAVWKTANPALQDFRDIDEMRSLAHKAKEIPALQNTFRRLYLNEWTEQSERWIDMAAWEDCKGDLDWRQLREAMKGKRCVAGLDLSSRTDLTALALVFEDDEDDSMTVLPFFWVPEEGAAKRSRADRVPYEQWIRDGLLKPTSGNVVDQGFIRQDINNLARDYKLSELGFDPWNATKLSLELKDDGVDVVEMRQGFRTLSEPTKHLGALVTGRKLRHGGHPVLKWMASNMVVRQDPNGNLSPDKSKVTERIDGIVALIIGIAVALVQQKVEPQYQAYVYGGRR